MKIRYKQSSLDITYRTWDALAKEVDILKSEGAVNFVFDKVYEYGDAYCQLTYEIPMTPEEIEQFDKKQLEEERARKEWKRKQYEALKKELEE